MIDISNIKAPGWSRVVAELSAGAPDDRAYMQRMLRVLAQVSAARQSALWLPDHTEGEEVEPKAELVWPPTGSPDADEAVPAQGQAAVESADDAKAAARSAFGSGQSRAFGLDKQETYYEASPGQGFILAIPLWGEPAAPAAGREQGTPAAVVTLLIEPRGKEAVRSTLAMAEVLAGYLHGHSARQSLKRTQQASFALELATRLIGSINTAPSFKGACLQLTNDLAKQFGVDRAALGWVRGDTVHVQAISDTEHFDKRMAMVQKLQAAMDECLDQEQPVVYPQPPGDGPQGDVLLSQAIVHAHRELAAGNAKLKVASFPLRVDEETAGVLTIESAGEGDISLDTIELIQAAMDLVAPVLRIRRSDDRVLPLRAWDSAVRAAGWAVGPKHTAWKLVSVLVFAAAVFVTVYHTTYRVGAEAVLEPRVRRIVSVPFDGVIKALGDGVEAGKAVKEGDLLVELDTTEYRLGLAQADAAILQAQKQADAARNAKDSTKVAQYELEERSARAQAEQYRYRLDRSRITAPIGGVIISGDLRDKVGATVKLGDPLFQLGRTDDIVCTARVDERDIALVKRAFDSGAGTGAIATKSAPSDPLAFVVERIVPMAIAGEGKNVFEVRCRIVDTPENRERLARTRLNLVSGMEGEAKFDTERWSLLHIGTRRILDQVRMWWW